MKDQLIKIVVFVPKSHSDLIRQVIGDAGAGKIGNYSHCSYSMNVIGRYKPLEDARPTIGKIGKFEKVDEERIEFVSKRSKAKQVIKAIKEVHPYEEVAYDIYPLILESDL